MCAICSHPPATSVIAVHTKMSEQYVEYATMQSMLKYNKVHCKVQEC
jgi:hypothetical protein